MPQARETRKAQLPLLMEEPPPELPFIVEHRPSGLGLPKVLGRTANPDVAMAMFKAAAKDYRSGLVLLKHGERVLMRSGS